MKWSTLTLTLYILTKIDFNHYSTQSMGKWNSIWTSHQDLNQLPMNIQKSKILANFTQVDDKSPINTWSE